MQNVSANPRPAGTSLILSLATYPLTHHHSHASRFSLVQLRYTDFLSLEQDRGISLKCAPMTMLMQDSRDKSYVMNIVDTPGMSCVCCTLLLRPFKLRMLASAALLHVCFILLPRLLVALCMLASAGSFCFVVCTLRFCLLVFIGHPLGPSGSPFACVPFPVQAT